MELFRKEVLARQQQGTLLGEVVLVRPLSFTLLCALALAFAGGWQWKGRKGVLTRLGYQHSQRQSEEERSDSRLNLAVGWAWYLGTLVPVLGLVQVGRQYMADRYTYVPLIGPHFLAGP